MRIYGALQKKIDNHTSKPAEIGSPNFSIDHWNTFKIQSAHAVYNMRCFTTEELGRVRLRGTTRCGGGSSRKTRAFEGLFLFVFTPPGMSKWHKPGVSIKGVSMMSLSNRDHASRQLIIGHESLQRVQIGRQSADRAQHLESHKTTPWNCMT